MGSGHITQAGLDLLGSRHHPILAETAEWQAVATVSQWLWDRHSLGLFSPLSQLLLIRGTHWGSAFWSAD